jgi:MFS family permease
MTRQRETAGRRAWLGLLILTLPGLVVTMDLTVLHLAVPSLIADLNPTPTELLWIVDIYGFLLAGSLITMGTLGDRIGRRKLLLIGAGAFTVASILAANAASPGMLIAARALLGVAGATLAPSTLSLVRNLFLDDQQRAVAIGYWVAGFVAGAALGPLVGGLVIENAGWEAVFLLPVPVMALLLVAGPVLLPEFRDPHAGQLDLASVGLSVGAVLSGVYGLKHVAQDGPSLLSAETIGVGLVLGALFVRRQRRLSHPLIDLDLFGSRAFSATAITLTLNSAAMFAASFFNAQYMQLALGLSPAQAGLWTLPGVLAVLATSQLAPRLLRWSSSISLMIGGSIVCTLGFVAFSQVPVGGLPVLIVGSLLTSLGAGPIATLANGAIVGAAPPERAGAAAAISQTSVDLSGSLGMAVIGSVGLAVYRAATADMAPAALAASAPGAFGESYLAFALIGAALMLIAAGVLGTVVNRVPAAAGSGVAGHA